ncbi:GroES-like protein [Cutaneotrichosporon oleaginosum]|uniref:GroES-like protein n=1 Tax=Cutaneotrichosporon oleaginosum TaxID=879819 RepID=A0A0J0XSC2_9TREE|nr:GroES-like protein [Cutaneotrichosporon oleaginosum]KLT43962.1 GroES-like protein [Cutaneotrichosporon oleaginosum]TXT04091.1 hypothetical protein COLE_07788 [Cutaneotrichosporon oleaginosum]
MDALVLTPSTRSVTLTFVPTPKPGPGEVLIKVHAIALNPIDSLYVLDPVAETDRVIGTDFAGTVAELGEGVRNRKVGDRVAGFVQGACSTNDRPGCFAEYVVSPWDLLWAVPASMQPREAATVSMCGLTAAQGAFYRLGVPLPPDFPTPAIKSASPAPLSVKNATVLVYGGSTSLGMFALQLLRRALPHAQIIAVASAKHAQFLSASPYTADTVVDYRNDAWPDDVRALAPQGVDYALDCISEGATVERVHSTLAEQARLAVFRSPSGGGFPADLRVSPIYGAVWEGLGHDVGYNGGVLPADPAARAFAVAFDAYLSLHPLEPNPTRLLDGGLARVTAEGFALLGGPMVTQRSQPMVDGVTLKHLSGEKAVYEIVIEP